MCTGDLLVLEGAGEDDAARAEVGLGMVVEEDGDDAAATRIRST